MTVVEHSPPAEEVLDFVDDSIRNIREAGGTPGFIVVGPQSHASVSRAISVRFHRGKGTFDTYAHLPIVVDPARTDQILVLPSASDAADGLELIRAS